ncbi:ATP-dependent DNA helicase PIF1-like protein [Tanacetum coccineum]
MKEYYSYTIHHRRDQGTTLIRGGRIFQQYLVDAYTAIEEQRLKWTRNNQDALRVDLYHNVCDAVTRGDTNAAGLGKRIVLPGTFTELLDDLQKNKSLAHAVELCMSSNSRNEACPILTSCCCWKRTANARRPLKYSAELPYPTDDLDGHKVVIEYMLHGPCRTEGRYAPCTTEAMRKLNFHLPEQNPITLRDSENLPALLQRESIDVTMFTDWFDLNERHPQPEPLRMLRYQNSTQKVLSAHAPECYTRASKLLTVNNRLCETVKAACFAYGLLNDDKEWTRAISEASGWALGPQLRDLFVTILLFCDVSRPLKLWEETWELLLEDILFKKQKLFKHLELQLTPEQIQNYCLVKIQELLNKSGRLTQSMRVNEYNENGTRKQDFNQWVLAVGDRTLPAKAKDGENEPTWIEIPKEFLIKLTDSLIEQIVTETYPNFIERQHDDD